MWQSVGEMGHHTHIHKNTKILLVVYLLHFLSQNSSKVSVNSSQVKWDEFASIGNTSVLKFLIAIILILAISQRNRKKNVTYFYKKLVKFSLLYVV